MNKRGLDTENLDSLTESHCKNTLACTESFDNSPVSRIEAPAEETCKPSEEFCPSRKCFNLPIGSVSTSTGGITIGHASSATNKRADAELDLLKSIIHREGLLKKLQKLEIKSRKKLVTGLIELLDILRITTVEVVEAVVFWRASIDKSIPYLWNGVDYLVKISSDLDFLENNIPLVEWLRFSPVRNPFLIPFGMERRPGSGGTDNIDSTLLNEKNKASNQSTFSVIGSSRIGNNATFDCSMIASKKKRRKAPRSYLTPVLNDTEMIPVVDVDKAKPLKRSLKKKHIFSVIGDFDMLRFRKAERDILAEEALYGRFSRNKEGHLVPSLKADQEKFSILLKADDFHPIDIPSKASERIAPFAVESGVGFDSAKSLEKMVPATNLIVVDASYNKNYQKQGGHSEKSNNQARNSSNGGELFTLPFPGDVRGSKYPPMGINRSATLGIDLNKKKLEIDEMIAEVKLLQNKLEELPLNNSKDSDIRYQIIDKEKVISIKSRMLRERENQIRLLKYYERKSQDRKRARILEGKRRLLEDSVEEEAKHEVKTEEGDLFSTLKDESVIKIQKIVRGKLGRTLCHSYRECCESAAKKIQSGTRGMFSRKRVAHLRLCHIAATCIQRCFRGVMARKRCKLMLSTRRLQRVSTIIQKRIRGMIDRRYIRMKQIIERHALSAIKVVSESDLSSSDLRNLGGSIFETLIGFRKTFPNPSVLALVNLVCLMLGIEEKEIMSVTRLGVQSKFKINMNLSWGNAAKVLRRPWLIRYMRNLAHQVGNGSPRKLIFSKKTVDSYLSLEIDPLFSYDKMDIGKGSRACVQLMKWVKSIFAIHNKQSLWNEERDQHWIQTSLWHAIEKLKLLIDVKIREISLSVIRSNDQMLQIKNSLIDAAECQYLDFDSKFSKFNSDYAICQKRELSIENKRLYAINTTMLNVKHEIFSMKEALIFTEKDHDLFSDINYISNLKNKIIEKEVILYNRKMRINTYHEVRKRNQEIRNILNLKLDSRLELLTLQIGEIDGNHAVLKEMKRSKFKMICESDLVFDSEIEKSDDQIKSWDDSMELMQEQKNSLQKQMYDLICQMEKSLKSSCELAMKAGDTQIHNTRSYIIDEVKDDAIEEEILAQEENQRIKLFVPSEFLNYHKVLNPIIICMGRDVPSLAKEKIIQQLTLDLQDQLVRINVTKNFGLDVEKFQAVIDTGRSILAEVDVGLTFTNRRLFLHVVSIVKKSLFPEPICFAVMGNMLNRLGKPTKAYLGVAEDDLFIMKDGDMKKCSEKLNFLTREFYKDYPVIEVKKIEKFTAPSLWYVIVLEAVLILLTPQSFFRKPLHNLNLVSWKASKQLLSNPRCFLKKLIEVDCFNIPDHNLSVLSFYLTHEMWPKLKDIGENEIFFGLLIDWMETIIKFGSFVSEKGGNPDVSQLTRSGIFSDVFIVSDVVEDDNIEIFDRSWKTVYDRLLFSSLKDINIFEKDCILNSKSFCANSCAVGGNIFFFVKDKTSSDIFFARININDVNALLTPDGINCKDYDDKRCYPPKTVEEMHGRLTDLLILEKRCSGNVLSCRKKPQYFNREAKKICGHVVTCSMETSPYFDDRSLTFHVYIPRFCCSLNLCVTEKVMLSFLKNSDVTSQHLQDDLASACSKSIAQRLKIVPRFRTITDMLQAKTSSGKNWIQKLKLNLRLHGGSGYELLSFPHKMLGIFYVVTVHKIEEEGTLRINAYNQVNCDSFEIKLNVIDQLLCHEGAKGDLKILKLRLLKRLSLRTPDENECNTSLNELETKRPSSLHFDRSLFQITKNISNYLFNINIFLVEINGGKIGLKLILNPHHEICVQYILLIDYSSLEKIAHVTSYIRPLFLPAKQNVIFSAILKCIKYNGALKVVSFISDDLELFASANLIIKEGVSNDKKGTPTSDYKQENKESADIDNQDDISLTSLPPTDNHQEENYQHHELISCADKKILRKIVKINGSLLHVTVFEVKDNDDESDKEAITSSLRFTAYDPSKCNRFTITVSNEEIDERFSLIDGDDNRSSLCINSKDGYRLLADALIEKLQLISGRDKDKSPELTINWPPSDGSKSAKGKSSRLEQKDQLIRQKVNTGRRLMKGVFMIPQKEVAGGRCEYQSCIVSITGMMDLAIGVDVYIPSISRHVQILISGEEQKKVLNDRPVMNYTLGIPRNVAINSIIKCLSLTISNDSDRTGYGKVEFSTRTTWLEAYSTFGKQNFH